MWHLSQLLLIHETSANSQEMGLGNQELAARELSKKAVAKPLPKVAAGEIFQVR